MSNNVSAGPSGSKSSLATLDKQMKDLLAAFQKQGSPNFKEKSFYDDAVTIKRLKAKLHGDGNAWTLYMMMSNDYTNKNGQGMTFPPSIISLPAADLEEFLAILQGITLEVLTAGKANELSRIANHQCGQETDSKKEDFWNKDFTSFLKSGNLLLRPWKTGLNHFIKILSPRPPSNDYEWLGVQMTLFIEEAVYLCSHLQEFIQELGNKGVI